MKATRSILALLLCSAAVLSARAQAPAGPDLTVASFTGDIEIEVAGQTVKVAAGGVAPHIPAGAKIRVLSGTAVLTGDKVSVSLDAGANVQYNSTVDNGVTKVDVMAAAGSSPVKVEVGGTVAVVTAASAVNVQVPATGAPTITASQGSVTLQLAGGQTQTLAQGQSTAAAAGPTTTAQGPTQNAPPPMPTAPPPPPQTTNQDHTVVQVVSPSAP